MPEREKGRGLHYCEVLPFKRKSYTRVPGGNGGKDGAVVVAKVGLTRAFCDFLCHRFDTCSA